MNLEDSSQISQSILETANELIGKRQYREALDLLAPRLQQLRSVDDQEELLEVLKDVGICYFELGQYQQASQCFREGIHIARARLAALPDEASDEETFIPSQKQKAERALNALH